jgi:hypothetical protein
LTMLNTVTLLRIKTASREKLVRLSILAIAVLQS